MFKKMFLKNKKKNILILGSNGMLGYDIFMRFRKLSQLRDSNIGIVIGLDIEDKYDFADPSTLKQYFDNCISFDYCINCIAYTDTAKAETDCRDLSYKLNALIPKYIAEACMQFNVKLIHISTDYIFSEKTLSEDRLIKEFDNPFPVNMYGLHKLLGEQFIQNAFLKWKSGYSICRTSWLYGMHNSKSFIHKFMRNVVRAVQNGSNEIEMTENEVSIPTSTKYVVDSICSIVNQNKNGIFHTVPLSASGISRTDWAKLILDSYSAETKIGDIHISEIKIKPVQRDTYQPTFSAMQSSMLEKQDCFDVLSEFMNTNGQAILQEIFDSDK